MARYIILVCVQKEAKAYTQHPAILLRICTIFLMRDHMSSQSWL